MMKVMVCMDLIYDKAYSTMLLQYNKVKQIKNAIQHSRITET